jgi:hypothetical protein
VRLEFEATVHEHPGLSAPATLKVAITRINGRAMWAYNVTRTTVHFGREVNRPRLQSMLFSECPEWLSPNLSAVEAFLDAVDDKRKEHSVQIARTRLETALRQLTECPVPLILENGNLFLYWRSGPGNTVGGYKGPTVCIGTHRALVIGSQGGHIVTAHR